jgi:proline racemase
MTRDQFMRNNVPVPALPSFLVRVATNTVLGRSGRVQQLRLQRRIAKVKAEGGVIALPPVPTVTPEQAYGGNQYVALVDCIQNRSIGLSRPVSLL